MKRLCFLFCVFIPLFLFSQTDTEFWFAAPEVSQHNQNFDRPIVLRITSYNQNSTVTISQPANPLFIPIVVNVSANNTTTVDLTTWINQIENKPPNVVLNYGLRITATHPVTVYYEVISQQCQCNPEIFALKGRNALGRNFFIPSQNFVNNGNYSPTPYSSFDIVATENNTTVTITPSANIVGHAAGVPFSITLNRGQTYSATATSQLASQRLMGSTVVSDKPIAITIKDDLMHGAPYGGCADLGGDQLVPIDYIGTKYVVVRGFLNPPHDKVFILATQNNTSVSVDGSLVATLNTGQTYMVDMPTPARFIETSQPAYVLHLSGFGCEIGLSLLPPIECTGSSSVAIARSTTESMFLILIVQNGGQNNFLFNGNSGVINGAAFAPVPGTGGQYHYAQVTISTAQLPAGSSAIVSNTSHFFHLGLIHGGSNSGTRYGYFSNFNKIDVVADTFSTPVCIGSTLTLNANASFGNVSYTWSGPNGFFSNQKNPSINNIQPVNSGNYVVVASFSGCVSQPDTVVVQVTSCGQQVSGIINTYTPVTDIDKCSNSVTVGSALGFAVGDRVLLIQMKGAQINTSNSAAFGDITGYGDAGNYEFANIQSINGNKITFVNAIQNNYTISGLVQLIRVPQYQGNIHVVNTPVTCPPWNGSTGGVIALEAAGTVVLSADIDASDKGFRAGVANDNSPYNCNQQDYFYPFNSSFGGRKGEGVHDLPASISNGRGKNANGGGGGNDTNSGGGGGGNGGTGGRGGNQWVGCPNLPIGGEGGVSLSYSNVINKIFLGGGAGGGHQNNAVATPGTNGGGIIIIKSNAIQASGGSIKAFANDGVFTSGDGSGGGGAGGTVLLHTNNITGNLTIDVHGGKGGDNSGHGPGGGGGGGVVWSNNPLPANVSVNLQGGQPGFDSNTNSNHGAAAGAQGITLTGLVLQESNTPFAPLPKPVATAPSNVCSGGVISLSVGNIQNVSWNWSGPNGYSSSVQNPSINSATITNSGDYIVVARDNLGCEARDTVTVNVRPTYNVSLNANICSGSQYVLPKGLTVLTPGSYRDTLSTIYGCDSIITINLSVTQNTLSASNDVFICKGDTATLTATGALTYSWKPSQGLSDTASATVRAYPLQTTTYTVTGRVLGNNLVTNGDFESGNTGFTTDYLYSSPNPLAPPGYYTVSTSITNNWWANCPDHTTGTGNMMIIDGADGNSSSVPVGANIWCQTVSVIPNTEYAFSTWLTNINSQYATSQLRFSINGVQIGNIQNTPIGPCQWNQFYVLWHSGNNTTATLCIAEVGGAQPGNDFALDDISFAPVCYFTDTVFVNVRQPQLTNQNRNICEGDTFVRPSGNMVFTSGTYFDTLQNIYGCDSIVITQLGVFPTYRDSVNAQICQGETYNLPDGNAVTVPGRYVSLLSTKNGCDSVIITELSVLPNSANAQNVFICPNATYTLPGGRTVSNPGTYLDTLQAANGCDSLMTTILQWYPAYNQSIFDTICVGNSYMLPNGNMVSQEGDYNVLLTTVHGCDSSFLVRLKVSDIALQADVDSVRCFGESNGKISVKAEGGIGPYTFSLNAQTVQTEATQTVFSNLVASGYTILVTDRKGCTEEINVEVGEPSPLLIDAAVSDASCFGYSDGTAILNVSGGSPAYRYLLNGTQQTMGMFTKLPAGNYTAVVTDANNCTASINVTINQPDEILIEATPNPLILSLGAKDTIHLSSNYDPEVNYFWTPATGLSCTNCSTVWVNAIYSISYTVRAVANINGKSCESFIPVEVKVEPDYTFYIPNTFTPNGDGVNDWFEWFGNKEAIKLFDIKVFNRWGEKVFESNDINFRWDGFYQGKPAPQDVYAYVIKIVWLNDVNENRYKGSVTLMR